MPELFCACEHCANEESLHSPSGAAAAVASSSAHRRLQRCRNQRHARPLSCGRQRRQQQQLVVVFVVLHSLLLFAAAASAAVVWSPSSILRAADERAQHISAAAATTNARHSHQQQRTHPSSSPHHHHHQQQQQASSKRRRNDADADEGDAPSPFSFASMKEETSSFAAAFGGTTKLMRTSHRHHHHSKQQHGVVAALTTSSTELRRRPHHKATPERVRLHAAMPPSSRHKPQKQRLGEGGGGKLPSHQRILRDWQREHQWFVAGEGHRSTHTSAASRSKRRRPHKKSAYVEGFLRQMDSFVRPRFG